MKSIIGTEVFSRFCYRRVCEKCSKHRLQQPVTRKVERCCNTCFTKFFTEKLLAEKKLEIHLIRENCAEVRRKRKAAEEDWRREQEKKDSLEATLSRLLDETRIAESEFIELKQKLDTELEATAKENNEMEKTAAALETEYSAVLEALQKAEGGLKAATYELANNNVKLNELKSFALQQEDENEALRYQLEAARKSPSQSRLGKSDSSTDEISKAVEIATARLRQLTQEEAELTRKVEEADLTLTKKEKYLKLLRENEDLNRQVGLDCAEATVQRQDEEVIRERLRAARLEQERLKKQLAEETASSRDSDLSSLRESAQPQRTSCCRSCTIA